MDFLGPAIDLLKSLVNWEDVRTGVVVAGILAAIAGAWAWIRRRRRADSQSETAGSEYPPATSAVSLAGQSAATEMLATIADMRMHLAALDAIHPQAPRRLADSVPASARAAAHHAQAQMERHAATRAVLLPDELTQRCHNAVSLLAEYSRGATQGPDRWPGELVNRAQTDVDNYLQYLARSLAEYVKTGKIIKECHPPVLRRSAMESWQPS